MRLTERQEIKAEVKKILAESAPFSWTNLIHRAKTAGYITSREAFDKKIVDAAKDTVSEYSYWDPDQGFGSSDFTFALKAFLENAGIPVKFQSNKLVRVKESVGYTSAHNAAQTFLNLVTQAKNIVKKLHRETNTDFLHDLGQLDKHVVKPVDRLESLKKLLGNYSMIIKNNKVVLDESKIDESKKIKVNEALSGWVIPFEIKWQQEATGIYHVVIYTENSKKKVADVMLSDSMPNDMGKLNTLLLKIISDVNRWGR